MDYHWKNIVRCAVRNIIRFNNKSCSRVVYWHAVAELCGLGSTSAIELCTMFGIDPHQKFPERDVEKLASLFAKEMEDDTQELSEMMSKMWTHIDDALED